MIQYLSKTSIAFTTIRQQARLHPSICSKNHIRKFGSKSKDSVEEERSAELNWDQFDYSQNPKNLCFDKNANQKINLNDEDEAEQDKIIAKKVNKRNDAYFSLSTQDVNAAIKVLEPFINADRQKRISGILRQRTKRSKFLFENPSNPSNVWACLRTIDSFGIQNVDIIIDSGRYAGKQALSQKRDMRTAVGSAQWLSLKNHGSTSEAIDEIRNLQGYKIYASDLSPSSIDVRDIDWDDGPICVVMGNEVTGITEEMRSLADKTFTLPMCGFAESFNLSVATSITLAHMSAKSKDGKGPLQPGDLDEHEHNCLYLKGLINSISQKRIADSLLRQNGIVLPKSFNLL